MIPKGRLTITNHENTYKGKSFSPQIQTSNHTGVNTIPHPRKKDIIIPLIKKIRGKNPANKDKDIASWYTFLSFI